MNAVLLSAIALGLIATGVAVTYLLATGHGARPWSFRRTRVHAGN